VKVFLYGAKNNTGSQVDNLYAFNNNPVSFDFKDTNDVNYLYYYLSVRANTGTTHTIFVEDVTELVKTKTKLEQEITESNSAVSLMSNAAHGNHIDFYPFFNTYLEEKYYSSETSLYQALKTRTQTYRTNNPNTVQIAFCTDTHEGGYYAKSLNSWALRPIAIFNRISAYTDVCMHGGDISCDYGTSKERYFAYMQEVINLFQRNSPMLITKGNHDEKDSPYEQIDALSVDWNSGTYYTTTNGTIYTQVTKDTYRGGELYIQKPDLIPDSWFRFIQAFHKPVGAVWGNGAYYYYDINSLKVRFVVGNSFPVNDSGVIDETEEWRWFAEDALDLSEKDVPTDWVVICLRHTESTSNEKFNIVVSAFMNGTSMSIAEATVNYGTLNGGGIKFIHLHGHEHGSAGYSNMPGYLDIGFPASTVSKSDFGDASKYGIFVLNINRDNNKMIIDGINNKQVQYDYANNIIELAVGQTMLMARSGMSGQSGSGYTWTSSDNSIATVSDGVVTGVSAGTVTITGIQLSNQKTVTYTVKVVS
jgi:hypothetical protein